MLTSPFFRYSSQIGVVITQNKGLPLPHRIQFHIRRHRRSVKYDWISFNCFFSLHKNCVSVNCTNGKLIWHLLRGKKLAIWSNFKVRTPNLFTRTKRELKCLHCVQINIDEPKLKYLIGPIGITLRNGMTTDKATVYFCYFNWNNDDFLRKSWISFAKTETNTEKNSSYRFSHFALWIHLLDKKRSGEYEKLQLP